MEGAKNMDVVEIRQRKQAYERQISDLLVAFQREIKLPIENVSIDRLDVTSAGDSRTNYVYAVRLDVLV